MGLAHSQITSTTKAMTCLKCHTEWAYARLPKTTYKGCERVASVCPHCKGNLVSTDALRHNAPRWQEMLGSDGLYIVYLRGRRVERMWRTKCSFSTDTPPEPQQTTQAACDHMMLFSGGGGGTWLVEVAAQKIISLAPCIEL